MLLLDTVVEVAQVFSRASGEIAAVPTYTPPVGERQALCHAKTEVSIPP
jgi:hypothetical protein